MSSSVIHTGFLLLLNIFITQNLGDTYLKWSFEMKKLALRELIHSDDWDLKSLCLTRGKRSVSIPFQTNVTFNPGIIFEEHFCFHIFSLPFFFPAKELESSPCGWRLFFLTWKLQARDPLGKVMRGARCALIGRDCWWSWVRPGVPQLILTWRHHSRLLMTLWLPLVIHVEGTSESLALTHTHVCMLLMTHVSS